MALGYLVAAPLWLPSIHNEWVVLGVEAVTWILWYERLIASHCPPVPDGHTTNLAKIRKK